MIAANHVIFLEPCTSPANELQAIGRIRRIGQRKPQYVWKFIMQESVEEKISERTAALSSASHQEKNQHLRKQVQIEDTRKRDYGESKYGDRGILQYKYCLVAMSMVIDISTVQLAWL